MLIPTLIEADDSIPIAKMFKTKPIFKTTNINIRLTMPSFSFDCKLLIDFRIIRNQTGMYIPYVTKFRNDRSQTRLLLMKINSRQIVQNIASSEFGCPCEQFFNFLTHL